MSSITTEWDMPVCKLHDGSGETLRILKIDDYIVPTFDTIFQNQEEVFRTIPDWKLRPDDIFLCAFPKSGTHWLWEVTSMLVNQSSHRVQRKKETSMLEGIPKLMFDHLKSPRVINTHILPHLMPRDFLTNKVKILFVQRNPKDVMVSFYNHHKKLIEYEYDGTFKNYFNRFLKGFVDYGSWFDYILEWERFLGDNTQHPVLFVNFEEMKADSIKEITRISEFLGLQSDNKLIEEIAEKCVFDQMKLEKSSMHDPADWKNNEPCMYRKGQVGDWKNWFTVAQNEWFDNFIKEKMKTAKLKFIYCL